MIQGVNFGTRKLKNKKIKKAKKTRCRRFWSEHGEQGVNFGTRKQLIAKSCQCNLCKKIQVLRWNSRTHHNAPHHTHAHTRTHHTTLTRSTSTPHHSRQNFGACVVELHKLNVIIMDVLRSNQPWPIVLEQENLLVRNDAENLKYTPDNFFSSVCVGNF